MHASRNDQNLLNDLFDMFSVVMKATLERSVRQMDTDHDSPLKTFDSETLVMALGLLGALFVDSEQVFHTTLDIFELTSGGPKTTFNCLCL